MARTFIPHTITDDSAIGGQVVQGSTIFDSISAAHLKRTPSSVGNRRTFTISLWTRKTPNGGGAMFGAYISNDNRAVLRFISGNVIEFQHAHSSNESVKTTAPFRGFNGWYHIVVAIDTTQASQSNRGKIYVNGVEQSLQTNSLTENIETSVNNNTIHVFGTRMLSSGANSDYDGQLAQINLIDGQQLDASYFGYFDFQTGIWRPKKYTGAYGTNGVYLPLDGLQHISRDLSGNGNHFTPDALTCTVPLHMATGGLPILKTNSGGTTACPGVRPDPLASNIVLALPLSDRSATAIGVDVHHLIKGSGSPKTLTNTGSIATNITEPHFYGRSGAIDLVDASSDRVEISTSDDFNMGTGDFTVECWIHPKSAGAADGSLFVLQTLTGGEAYFAFNYSPNTGRFNIYLNTGSAGWSPTVEEDLIEYTKWNHVALVKHSNVVKLYVNGLAIGSYSHSGQVGYDASVTTICRIGGGGSGALNLYMQDMRIYKGVAKYTDTFTCGSPNSAVVPDSPSGVAVSRKFKPSLSGSVGFEGSNSNLTAPHHTDLNATNQDFCFEAFIYPVGTTSNYGYVFNKGVGLQIAYNDSSAVSRMTCFLGTAGGGSYDIANDFNSGTGSVPLHQWSHFALVRSSGYLKWYINGIEKASTSISATIHANTNDFIIGAYTSTQYEFKGNISNARITIGQAVYTSNFTTPTKPLSLTSQSVTSSNVKLLCCKDKFDESAVDKIPTGSLTVNNSAKATSFSPFIDDVDSRVGGYPTLNEHLYRKAGSVMEGNLNISGANYTLQKSTVIFGPGHITTGKYYWEIDNGGGGTYAQYSGITGEFDQSAGEIPRQANKSWLGSTAYKNYNTTSETTFTNLEQGTISFALDVDNRVLRGYYNNRLIYTDTTIPNASTTKYAPFTHCTNDGSGGAGWLDAFYNFGQRAFTFTPPEGYESLGSANISPTLVKVNKSKNHFDVLTYTGDQTNGTRSITGLEFTPDFVWLKCRSSATSHNLYDSVRGFGANKELCSDKTQSEGGENGAQYGYVTQNSSGFNLVKGSDSTLSSAVYNININNATYVAWCWKAGGTAVANNDGAIASSVSVNKEAGFSIVGFQPTAASTAVTIGHGLGAAPDMIIVKSRGSSANWDVFHSSRGSGKKLYLNGNNAEISSSAWGSTDPTGSVFTYNPGSQNNNNHIAYCWNSVPGYSLFGQYYGNGQSDGKFVYTGFKPAMIMTKRVIGTDSWQIWDNKRDVDNVMHHRVFPNESSSETTTVDSASSQLDFYSTGFKWRGQSNDTNGGDVLYVYMAFAEQPAVNQYGSQSNER